MSSFFGYGSTGHSDNNNNDENNDGSGSASNRSSSANPSPPLLQQHHSTASDMTVVTADGIVPNPTATNEKTPLQYQAYPNNNNGADDYGKENHDHNDDHDHDHENDGHDHAPGERCSLPQLIQPLVSHENHGMVESVVVKVMDSADVTQKVSCNCFLFCVGRERGKGNGVKFALDLNRERPTRPGKEGPL